MVICLTKHPKLFLVTWIVFWYSLGYNTIIGVL